MILRITNHNPNQVSVYLIFRGPIGWESVEHIHRKFIFNKHKNLSKIIVFE